MITNMEKSIFFIFILAATLTYGNGKSCEDAYHCSESGLYLGCYNSTCFPANIRFTESDFLEYKIESCLLMCDNMGYGYAGLLNGKDCLCACVTTSLGKLLDQSCGVPCKGDVALKCGGHNAIQIYNVTTQNPGESVCGPSTETSACSYTEIPAQNVTTQAYTPGSYTSVSAAGSHITKEPGQNAETIIGLYVAVAVLAIVILVIVVLVIFRRRCSTNSEMVQNSAMTYKPRNQLATIDYREEAPDASSTVMTVDEEKREYIHSSSGDLYAIPDKKQQWNEIKHISVHGSTRSLDCV